MKILVNELTLCVCDWGRESLAAGAAEIGFLLQNTVSTL